MYLRAIEALSPEPPDEESRRADEARSSLEAYVREAWKAVEPETPYHDNWHVGAVCYHLEAVTAGEIQHLLINIPPGFLKSLLATVFWPTWEWGPKEMPHLRYIAASNGLALAVRDTLRSRRLIQSEWYQRHYGTAFALTSDQNQKTRFDNDHKGYRLAKSVGSGTGERGNRVIFDDPHELDDVDYPEQLKAAVDYNNVTLDSRLADRERDSKIVVQQRVARNDVTGDILRKMEEGGKRYEVLCLPMRHDPAYQLSLTGRNILDWRDPRTEKGELLDPGRYSEESVAEDELGYGPQAAAVLGQKPEEGGKSVYKRGDLPRFDLGKWLATGSPGNPYGRYTFFDTAYEAETAQSRRRGSDFTGWAVFDVTQAYRIRLVECGMERLDYPDLLAKVDEVASRWNTDGMLREVIVERAASGKSAIQSLTSASFGYWFASLVRGFDPGIKSKVGRAKSASLWTRRGCVEIPCPQDAEWVEPFTEELFNFPIVEHDDRTDAFTMGILWLENILAEGLSLREGA